MAFQRAHLGPFKPRGMHVEEVPNWPTMVRLVAERRPRPRNEDLAIVTISPIPSNPLHFPTVEEVVRELLEEHKGIQVKEVVRFEHDRDRDRMVLESTHPYGRVNFTFVRHNQGRNWRRVNFNQDCWLMLLGFPNDYWEQEYVDTIMGPFGKAINWDGDETHLTRIIVKARVISLESVPHFIVFSNTEGFDGESWTIQCEILQHEHLGGGPSDEDPMPVQVEGQEPPQFDFFGLGQQILGPTLHNRNLIKLQTYLLKMFRNNRRVTGLLGLKNCRLLVKVWQLNKRFGLV